MDLYKDVSDEQLIGLIRTGREELTDYLCEKYKPFVKKQARTLFLIGGETEDLIQEGMIGLFKAIRDYREGKEASFQSFARLCILRQMYSAIQAAGRQKHAPLNSYVALDTELTGAMTSLWEKNPEELVIDQENVRLFYESLKTQLSSMEQQVLHAYLAGENYLEIAESMGKSPKSIDNALQRIRGKISKTRKN